VLTESEPAVFEIPSLTAMRDFVVLPYFFLDSTSRRRDSFCPHPFQFTPSSYCTPSSTYCWHTVITQRTSTRTCTCKNEL